MENKLKKILIVDNNSFLLDMSSLKFSKSNGASGYIIKASSTPSEVIEEVIRIVNNLNK